MLEWRPYILHVKDVDLDGNCGFRVVADLMGMGQDNWIQVRNNLVDELQRHFDAYNQLFGYANIAQEVLFSLSNFNAKPTR